MHALNYLGIMYAEGLGTPCDDAAAAAYFYKASVPGNPEAMANLERMHELGRGGKRDYQAAISEYCTPAANPSLAHCGRRCRGPMCDAEQTIQ